jgi:hypothetical protein
MRPRTTARALAALVLLGALGCDARAGVPADGAQDDAAQDARATPPDALVCAPPLVACQVACVDTAADPANCGGCGQACTATQRCDAGRCFTPCTGAGRLSCNDGCVDTRSDRRNCGGCGQACTATQVCSNGACAADPCTAASDCVHCIQNPACGWCVGTNSCRAQSLSDTCSIFLYGTC